MNYNDDINKVLSKKVCRDISKKIVSYLPNYKIIFDNVLKYYKRVLDSYIYHKGLNDIDDIALRIQDILCHKIYTNDRRIIKFTTLICGYEETTFKPTYRDQIKIYTSYVKCDPCENDLYRTVRIYSDTDYTWEFIPKKMIVERLKTFHYRHSLNDKCEYCSPCKCRS